MCLNVQIHVLYERFLFIIKALNPITTKPRNYLKDLHLFVIILLIIFLLLINKGELNFHSIISQ